MPASLHLPFHSSSSANTSPSKPRTKPSRRLSSYSTYSRSPNSLLSTSPNTATTSVSRVFASPEFELNEDNARPTLRSARSSASLRPAPEPNVMTARHPKVTGTTNSIQVPGLRGQDPGDAKASGADESPQILLSESPKPISIAGKPDTNALPAIDSCAPASIESAGDGQPSSPPPPAATLENAQPGVSSVQPIISNSEPVPTVDLAAPTSVPVPSIVAPGEAESTPVNRAEHRKPSGSWFNSLLGQKASGKASDGTAESKPKVDTQQHTSESEPQPVVPTAPVPETASKQAENPVPLPQQQVTPKPPQENVSMPHQEGMPKSQQEDVSVSKPQEILEQEPAASAPASADALASSPPQEAGSHKKSSSFWLSSLGRSKGKASAPSSTEVTKDTKREVQHVEPPTAEAAVEAVIKDEILPTQPVSIAKPVEEPKASPNTPQLSPPQVPTPTPQPASSQPIPSAQPIPKSKAQAHAAKKSWFSSSPTLSSPLSNPDTAHTASSPPVPNNIPLTHTNSSHTSLSIDDEVPKPSPTGIVFPTMQGEVVAVDGEENKGDPVSQSSETSIAEDGTVRRRRLSSLNPSSSRFTLTIPLLRRSKIPLSEAMAQNKDSAEPDAGLPDSQATVKQQLSPVPATPATEPFSASNETAAEGIDVVPATPVTEPSSNETSTAAAAPQTSWWGYYWSSTTTTTTITTETPTVSQPETQGTAPVENAMTSETKSETAITVQVTPPSPPQHHYASSDSAVPPPKPVERSISEDVASVNSQSAAAWYAPWTWYGTAAEPSTESKEEVPEGIGAHVKTESEIIKEEALAREDPVPPKDEAKPAVSPPVLENPVAQSIQANSSSWATFFSSNANLLMLRSGGRTVYPGRISATSSSDMETMTLDEEEEVPPTSTPPKKPESIASSKERKPAPVMTVSESVREEAQRVRKGSTGSTASGASKINGQGKKDEDRTPRRVIPSKNDKSALSSPASSRASSKGPPPTPKPNLVLPTWEDTFYARPRNTIPRDLLPPPPSKDTGYLAKGMKFVSGVLFDTPETLAPKDEKPNYEEFGRELPRAYDVLRRAGIGSQIHGKNKGKEKEMSATGSMEDILRGCRKVVVIGIHGWFPGTVMRSVLGEPTGTSDKFASMMVKALEKFQDDHGVKLEKITPIRLEGEGTITRRVEKLYSALLANSSWMSDLHECDAVLFATHSQGSIVSTHIIDRLIRDGHIVTSLPQSVDIATGAISPASADILVRKPQRICCLALCGIHLGPLKYLSSSSLIQPYFQYFESTAARELFEFQNTESQVSKDYVKALRNVTNHGTKMVYVASLNDQVVPIYSGIFAAASHPLILRALYIDGDAYNTSDFLSNLLVLLLRIVNVGLSDSGLLTHLSEATAGSLNGIGHSTAYEELSVYSLAVNYLFLTNDGLENEHPELKVEPFNAAHEQNDYEIPWSLRDLIASPAITHFFLDEIMQLRDAFSNWQPKTSILRDVKRKLQPITKLPRTSDTNSIAGPSRL